MKHLIFRARRLTALLAVALLALLAAPAALADSGDLDRINSYVVTVDPREDGSADITYDIDWEVIGGSADEPLSWVKIGLANDQVDSFENLTPDTVSGVRSQTEDGNTFARITFVRRYYAPDYAAQTGQQSQVQFSFRVHQSHLYTLSDDGTATYLFTPGWFDDLEVQELTIRWKASDGMAADTETLEDGYYVWTFGPMDHGEKATVRVQVPAEVTAVYDPSTEMLPSEGSGGDDLAVALMMLLFFGFVGFAIYWDIAVRPRWRGGFGRNDRRWYTNGIRTIRLAPGAVPPQGYRPTTPPPSFRAGGGSFRGGGAGRGSGGGCACACVSSCACACACAGGGRAGCSVKNFYRITVKSASRSEEESHEH